MLSYFTDALYETNVNVVTVKAHSFLKNISILFHYID